MNLLMLVSSLGKVLWANVTRSHMDRTLSPNTGGALILTATTWFFLPSCMPICKCKHIRSYQKWEQDKSSVVAREPGVKPASDSSHYSQLFLTAMYFAPRALAATSPFYTHSVTGSLQIVLSWRNITIVPSFTS